MDGFKQILVDDGWNAPFLLKIFVAVDSDIPSVAKHRLKAVPVEFSSLGCPVAFSIEHTANIGYGFSIGIEFKSLLDNMSSIGIDDQFVIFNLVAKRSMTTDTVTLQSGLSHASGDLLRKVSGIVFGYTLQDSFQDDTFRVFGNTLGGGLNLDTVLSEPHFENRTVFPVSSKAVKFPNNDQFPCLVYAGRNHLLEVDSFLYIFPSRSSTVNIDGYNPVVFPLTVGYAIPQLSFDRLFLLPL